MRWPISTGIRALVVDDEEAYRTSISRSLRARGHQVWEAQTYSDAFDIFNLNQGIDLLIADVSLPDGNGCALTLAMRRLKPDLRVLLTGFQIGARICRSYGLETTDPHFLPKPFDLARISKRIRVVLSSTAPLLSLIAPKTVGAVG